MPMDTVMLTNAFVWIDNPSTSVFIANPGQGLPGLETQVAVTTLSSSPKNTRIHCAGFVSPRAALVEDISPGSSLPESYCKH